jgi:hypothetical protein
LNDLQDESEEPPGRLIASGRAADVFDLGDGTVLRRYRSVHDSGPEGRLMGWLAASGVPVPVVHRAAGRDLVMDHVRGPSMLDDLHPMNVILGPGGPVVIDFTNATRGPATFDAAMSFVLMSTFGTTGVIDRLGQRLLVAAFRRGRGRHVVDAGLVDACRFRLADRNVTAGERERVQRLLAGVTSDTAASLL